MKSEHPGQCPVAVILKEPTAWGVILYLFPLKNSKYDRHIWKERKSELSGKKKIIPNILQ